MKFIFGTLFLTLFVQSIWAQSSLSGKVVDQNNKPLSGIDILLTNENKKTQRLQSDVNGFFNVINLTTGTLTVKAIGVGYKNSIDTIRIQNGENKVLCLLTEAISFLTPLEVKSIRASDKSPFAKSEITQKDIAKLNTGQDLPFLLNQMPSVVVNSDAGNGIGYTGIRIRGSDPTRTNVTINGIPYNDAESQGTFFVDIPDVASSAQSIQVQRGVGTSTNGAGAFGATVNINTNEIHQDAYATLSNTYSSFNSWKNTINAGTGLLNQHWYADVRLSHISSDGYIRRATSDLQSLLFSIGYVSDKTSVRFNFITGKEKTYQAWNGVPEYMMSIDRRYNELGMIKNDTFYSNQTDNYVQRHFQLFFNQKISESVNFNVSSFLTRGKGYYEEYKAGRKYTDYNIDPYVPFPNDTIFKTNLIRQKYLDNYFYGQTFALDYKKNKENITLGGSWSQYDGKHYGYVIWAEKGGFPSDYKYYGNLPSNKKDQNIYAKWLHQIDAHWNTFVDLQYRHVSYDINGYDDDPTLHRDSAYNFFNPKVGISYLNNGYNAYASFAMAGKEPNRDDVQAPRDKQPKAERLQDWELGVTKQNTNYHWGINLYHMNYKDQLVLTGQMNDVGAYTRTNAAKSYRAGIELQGGYVFAPWISFDGNITFSKNKIKDFTAYYDEYDDIDQSNWLGQHSENYHNTDISFAPNVVGSAILNLKPIKGVEISAIGKYVGKQYLDNTQNNTRKLNDYYNQDLRVIYTLQPNILKEISIIGYVYNAFNKMYNTNGAAYSYWVQGGTEPTNYNYYFPMSGTRYSIGVNIKL